MLQRKARLIDDCKSIPKNDLAIDIPRSSYRNRSRLRNRSYCRQMQKAMKRGQTQQSGRLRQADPQDERICNTPNNSGQHKQEKHRTPRLESSSGGSSPDALQTGGLVRAFSFARSSFPFLRRSGIQVRYAYNRCFRELRQAKAGGHGPRRDICQPCGPARQQ